MVRPFLAQEKTKPPPPRTRRQSRWSASCVVCMTGFFAAYRCFYFLCLKRQERFFYGFLAPTCCFLSFPVSLPPSHQLLVRDRHACQPLQLLLEALDDRSAADAGDDERLPPEGHLQLHRLLHAWLGRPPTPCCNSKHGDA